MSSGVSNHDWQAFMDAREPSPPVLTSINDDVQMPEVPTTSATMGLASDETTYLALVEANKAAHRVDTEAIRQSPHRPHTALAGMKNLAGTAAAQIRAFGESEDSYVTIKTAVISTQIAGKLLTLGAEDSLLGLLLEGAEYTELLLDLGDVAREHWRDRTLEQSPSGKAHLQIETGL